MYNYAFLIGRVIQYQTETTVSGNSVVVSLQVYREFKNMDGERVHDIFNIKFTGVMADLLLTNLSKKKLEDNIVISVKGRLCSAGGSITFVADRVMFMDKEAE